MIVVRQVFQTKFGLSGPMALAFKDSASWTRDILGGHAANVRVRILTDLSGPFNTVVQEIEVDSLAQWEQSRVRLFSDPRWHEMQARMQATMPDALVSGSLEFYAVEFDS